MTPSLEVDGVAVLPRLPDYVDLFAGKTPEELAIVCGSRRVDYGHLKIKVYRFAAALLDAGTRKGDRVAMLSPPCLEFWIVFLATAKIGALWVGLNPRYSERECSYVLTDAAPRLLITIARVGDWSSATLIAELMRSRPGLEVVAFGGSLDGARQFDEFVETGAANGRGLLERAARNVRTTDPCLIVYTSGSTGNPKGAVLSHYGLSFGATMQTCHFDVGRPSLVVAFPINHVAAVADTCATTLVKGGKIVFLPAFDPVETIRLTALERCTMIGGVPTMYQMQMSYPEFDDADLSSLELILWGGAAMPETLIRRLKKLGARLITAYGMTETATHVTYTDPDADLETLATTVGRPDRHCRIRIATENGRDSSESNSGEIQVRADFLLCEYWQRPDATRSAFTDDGWFRTGDIGYFRADGNLRLVGRLSDMFKSGGYNVYPREIETVLEAHPLVAMAAVVPVPDTLYQEVGCAWIKRKRDASVDAAILDAWCRDRLANYKRPKSYRIVDELPLLPVGKVDKQALKTRASAAGSEPA